MKKSGYFIFSLFFAALLTGCSTGIPIANYKDFTSNPDDFTICHAYSCTHMSPVKMSASDWNSVAQIFKASPVKNAEQERSKIARAIARLEQIAGAQTGTSVDEKEAVAVKKSIYQMDCIDETINTSQYLQMLQDAKLMRFHKRAEPTHRGYIVDGRWPHNTAVIEEVGAGAQYVVDSFYRPNGEEPYIVPRTAWLNGWRPKGATQ